MLPLKQAPVIYMPWSPDRVTQEMKADCVSADKSHRCHLTDGFVWRVMIWESWTSSLSVSMFVLTSITECYSRAVRLNHLTHHFWSLLTFNNSLWSLVSIKPTNFHLFTSDTSSFGIKSHDVCIDIWDAPPAKFWADTNTENYNLADNSYQCYLPLLYLVFVVIHPQFMPGKHKTLHYRYKNVLTYIGHWYQWIKIYFFLTLFFKILLITDLNMAVFNPTKYKMCGIKLLR